MREDAGMDEEFRTIASLAEVPEGELRAYDGPGARVALAHVENELFAFGDECTHEGCSLSEGAVDENEELLVCPCHGSAFDVTSGEPMRGPALDPVRVYPARARDGWVEVAPTPEGGS